MQLIKAQGSGTGIIATGQIFANQKYGAGSNANFNKVCRIVEKRGQTDHKTAIQREIDMQTNRQTGRKSNRHTQS